jgi:carboxypeptidase Q
MIKLSWIPCLFFSLYVSGQTNDSLMLRSIFNEALSAGESYSNLRSLCKDIGARLSGSAQAQLAVEWSENKMKKYGFDRIYKQDVIVPHWERGNKEVGWVKNQTGGIKPVHLLALGGSIGTNGLMSGELIEFSHLDELKKANPKLVENKIVFINQPMDEQQINTFKAYGGCYAIRGQGAVEAAKLGAKAVIIRSIGMPIDEHPHTGSMHYDDGIARIPAAAISTKDAETLHEQLRKEKIEFVFEMDCRVFEDAKSHNVIAEIKGTSHPENIITIGGHLDSWDTGEGAHDDGAGVIHCLEALRILKKLNYKPKNTIRVVFFMNEENGNKGGITYANEASKLNEHHIAAIESDRGGFSPRGFHCDGKDQYIQLIQSFQGLFKPYDLHDFDKGYGGVDIGPLKTVFPDIPLFGFVPDSQRYFDFHHAPSDVFENVNKRELELGAASVCSLVYLLDQHIQQP